MFNRLDSSIIRLISKFKKINGTYLLENDKIEVYLTMLSHSNQMSKIAITKMYFLTIKLRHLLILSQ